MILIEWMTKPKLMVTFLDNVIMWAEIIFIFLLWATWKIQHDEKRRRETRKRHGKHCTCFTCMGVR